MPRRDSDVQKAEEVSLLKRADDLDPPDSSTRLGDDDRFDEHDPLNIDPDYLDRSERTTERKRGRRSVMLAQHRVVQLADSNATISLDALGLP